ncbi:MAG: tyrosine-type recombinase/integrase, partial [Acidimicrobiales bacterium]
GSVVAQRWACHVATWKPGGLARRSDWLFTTTPESVDALGLSGISLRFRRIRAAAEVPEATLHRLRRTVGTHLLRNGDLLGAKVRLGHDNLSTTLRNYVDGDGLDDRGAATSLHGLYNDNVTGRPELHPS